jgi:hypothetical protein
MGLGECGRERSDKVGVFVPFKAEGERGVKEGVGGGVLREEWGFGFSGTTEVAVWRA